MRKSEEEIQLLKDWLRLAKENLLVAKSIITAENPAVPSAEAGKICKNQNTAHAKT